MSRSNAPIISSRITGNCLSCRLQWVKTNYPALAPSSRPVVCDIEPGEQLYFPTWWMHATLNLDDYTCFISTFQ